MEVEAEKLTRLGGSLPVPCVQELVKEQQLVTVPPRYVRPEQDNPIISDTSFLPQVPIIDMQSLLSEDSMGLLEVEKLHHACKEWGFFQLINHGVSSSLVDKVKLEIREFFKLPLEEKKKFGQEPGDTEGYGQVFVFSEEQKLDWADPFFMVTLPTHARKPHLLPKLPVPFRDIIEEYSGELKKLAMKILKVMEKALQMKSDEMMVLFEEVRQSMRMNYYPPCPQPEQVIGLTPHSDGSGLTILLQVNEVEGLQIKKDETWIPVTPLPNAFVVNIGDILEIVTNGIYRSVEHRAVVNSEKERLSVATFLAVNMDGDVGPSPSFISDKTPALFRRISFADFYKGFVSRELKGKSYLDVLRIENQDGHNN